MKAGPKAPVSAAPLRFGGYPSDRAGRRLRFIADYLTVPKGVGAGNPVLDAGRSKGARIDAYFDKARFANAAPGMIGTLGRNALEGPGTSNVDISLAKALPIRRLGEAGRGELRLETFNLFNRVKFSNPNLVDTTAANSTFGRITTQANTPRLLQLALRLRY